MGAGWVKEDLVELPGWPGRQATVVCDLVLLYLDAKADFYWKEKFEEAKPPKGKTEAAA